jgi:MFS family permease
MNESNPEAAPVQSNPMPSYKDRSTGLTIFGILTLLLGGLCALLVLMMLAGQLVLTRTNPPQANFVAVLPIITIYGGLAAALVWLGIGSILARRWARALLLIFSWSWLITGLIVLVMMAFVMPQALAQQSAANGNSGTPVPIEAVIAGMFLFLSIFFFVCPLLWTLFYKSPHVKATCEARDPVTRWTDACPLPVLALSLWLLPGASMMLFMPISAHGLMPFFGRFLTGLTGSFLCLLMAAVWACAAWLLYKLDVRGWWLILMAFLVVLVSTVMTYARHDMMEVYRLMGYPEAQIEQIQKTGLFTGHHMTWFMLFCMAPFLAYILFIKKYFQPRNPA